MMHTNYAQFLSEGEAWTENTRAQELLVIIARAIYYSVTAPQRQREGLEPVYVEST